jgi:hypothetical protein
MLWIIFQEGLELAASIGCGESNEEKHPSVRYIGAEALWECLVREGVDVVWGYPGGAALPLFDALSKHPACLSCVAPGRGW